MSPVSIPARCPRACSLQAYADIVASGWRIAGALAKHAARISRCRSRAPPSQPRCAISLLERGTLCSQCDDTAVGAQDAQRHLFPVGRINDLVIENMVNRHRLGGDWPSAVDEARAPLLGYHPPITVIENHILPANLADVVCAIAGGFEINDANAGRRHWRRFSPLFPRSEIKSELRLFPMAGSGLVGQRRQGHA